MSAARQLLRLRAACLVQAPRRGKAIANWKRPTMDEYLPPVEAYGPANDRRQKSFNLYFLGGTLSLIASLLAATALDVWEFNRYPYALIKEVRGTPIHDTEEEE